MNDDHSIPRGDAAPAAPAAQAAAPAARKVRTGYVRPIDFRHGRVDMTHGSGGRAMAQLIDELFARAFDNEWLRQGNDQAAFAATSSRRCSSRAATSAACRCTGRSTTSRWPGRRRSTSRPGSCWRRAFRWRT
jgi:hypothetical protein